jgi:hypothetical protein
LVLVFQEASKSLFPRTAAASKASSEASAAGKSEKNVEVDMRSSKHTKRMAATLVCFGGAHWGFDGGLIGVQLYM